MKTPFQLAPPSGAAAEATGNRALDRQAQLAAQGGEGAADIAGIVAFQFRRFWPRASLPPVCIHAGATCRRRLSCRRDARQAFDQLAQSLLVAFQGVDFLALGLEAVGDRGQRGQALLLALEQLRAAFLLLALDLRQLAWRSRAASARRFFSAATARSCWIRSALARDSRVRKWRSRADWFGSWPDSSSFSASESPPTNWRLSTRASWFCCCAVCVSGAGPARRASASSASGPGAFGTQFMQAPVGVEIADSVSRN
jgi:hypothetical protein